MRPFVLPAVGNGTNSSPIAKRRGGASRAACRRPGFTLVELLVVITIIGIIVALTMPAIQAAREAARVAQCKNNCKQMAMGCLSHESLYKFLPSGGWGWQWAADPDRGNADMQPGGWHYNILPFIEQSDLHDLGKAPYKYGSKRADGKVRADRRGGLSLPHPAQTSNLPPRQPG